MRFFLTAHIPEASRVLLVESGSRAVLERALARMRAVFPQARYDLCTCFPGWPADPSIERVWRVSEVPGFISKFDLLLRISRTRPPIAALLFTGEAVMFNWKLAFLFLLPSKLLVVNENGDFFWLDRRNLAVLRQFLGARWGVSGEEAIRGLCRWLFFPFVFVFLILGAAATYATRWFRLITWRIRGQVIGDRS